MQEPTNKYDLFENEAHASGEDFRRLHRLSTFLFAVSIVVSILCFLLFLPTLKNIPNLLPEVMTSKAGLQMFVSVVYTVVFIVLFPVQVLYYYKFTKAIREQNSLQPLVNRPIRFLLMNAKISCITFTVNLLYFLIFAYTEWSMYR